MIYRIWPVLLLSLFVSPASIRGQDAYTIKLKEPTKGDSVQVNEQTGDQNQLAFFDPAGNKKMERAEKKTRTFVYQETILERPSGASRPTKIKRQYEKAQVKIGEKAEDLAYDGKTLLIEKKGDKYQFQIEGDDKELTGPEAQYLNEEFNKDRLDAAEMRKAFLPQKAVKVNESWAIDAAPLIKELTKSPDTTITADTARAVATGKLSEVYQKDGRRFGKLDFRLELPIFEFIKGKNKIPLLPGAKLVLHLAVDTCIDGGTQTGTMKASMQMDATAVLVGPGGAPQGKSVIVAQASGQETRTEGVKK